MTSSAYNHITAFGNLLSAWKRAAKGKRGSCSAALFEHQVADRILELQLELRDNCYKPGSYTHFLIHDPKKRRISAVPFRDRVVHHALCTEIEPRFESLFIPDSYANRRGKGTHLAIDRLQQFSHCYRYVLRLDVVQYFASIDHELLLGILSRHIPESDVMDLVRRIVRSGDGILREQYESHFFPGDDLLSACRPRGLPIGNLTSQFWSNCYLHPFDLFVKRGLGCRAYLRYVDDFALFSNSKRELWDWKEAIVERLAELRLMLHMNSAQVQPCRVGIPWLGFVVFPEHRRLKSRKVRDARRRLTDRLNAYQEGQISFAELDATVQGWVNYLQYGDTWGLRRKILGGLVINTRRSSGRVA